MTQLQRVQLRLSEIRQRMTELAGIEGDLTDEQKAEIGTLRTEYGECETRAQALLIAEGSEGGEETTEETTEGQEEREYKELLGKGDLGELFEAVVEHRAVDGATAELQQEHKLAHNAIPLDLLTRDQPRTEHRAVTPAPANVGQMQQPIIPYVFPMSAAAYLGVRQPRVGVGEAVFPVLTTPPTVASADEGAEVDETTGSFSADVLQPRRLQASFFYSREDRARFAGMDAALRQALNQGLSDALDREVVAGANGFLGANGREWTSSARQSRCRRYRLCGLSGRALLCGRARRAVRYGIGRRAYPVRPGNVHQGCGRVPLQ